MTRKITTPGAIMMEEIVACQKISLTVFSAFMAVAAFATTLELDTV